MANAKIPLHKILFLDIETIPQQSKMDDLDPEWQALWEKKANRLRRPGPISLSDDHYHRAGIYAEFGQIICLSMGYCKTGEEEQHHLRIKSLYGSCEKELLEAFTQFLNSNFSKSYHFLCAHNGREFDFPYICRRMIAHGISLPKGLQIMGKKPWDQKHLLDTMRMWAFGDFKSYTSLELLAAVFHIPSPKDAMTGAQVFEEYYEKENLKGIVEYCEKDVKTLVNVYCALTGHSLISDENTTIIDEEEISSTERSGD